MKAPAQERAREPYVLIEADARAWGLAARDVARVLAFDEWRGSEPFDVGSTLDAASDLSGSERSVLVLASNGHYPELALLARGKVGISGVADGEIAVLPNLIKRFANPEITGVLFSADKSPVLLLGGEQLRELCLSHSPSPSDAPAAIPTTT